MLHIFKCLELFIFLANLKFAKLNELTEENLLYRRLMTFYEPMARPVLNHSTSLVIFFKIRLTQVLELNEKNQILTTSIWIEQVGLRMLEKKMLFF